MPEKLGNHGPTWNGKQEKWEYFFQSAKSQEFWTDWKSQGILAKILENEEILATFYFYFCSRFLIEVYLLNRF